MTAAIYAARSNLKAVIVERQVCGGLVNSTYVIENYPSHISINGMKLMERVHEQVLHLGVEVDQVAEVEALDLTGDQKWVETDEHVYRAPAVILATGSEPIRLPHLDHCDQVHYCSICDGPAYRGKRVIAIGGGNSGFDEALYLVAIGVEQVTIVEMMDRCAADEITQEKVARKTNVEVLVQSKVSELAIQRGRLNAVVVTNAYTGETRRIPAEGIFVFIGHRPNTTMIEGVIDLTARGYIPVDPDMATNLPGVFAAGDVIDKKYRQITTAMGDGTVAALSAAEYLRRTAAGRGD